MTHIDPYLYASILGEMSISLPEYVASGGRLHTKVQCKASRAQGAPKNCVIHKPSLHKLTGSPQVLRSSALIEDICKHGVGHPNPDSVAYLNWANQEAGWGVHGCDGCCGPVQPKKSKYDWTEGDFPT